MRRLAVLARAPSSGGKTRLTRGLDEERARGLRTALLADTLAAASQAGVPITVFVTPPDRLSEVADLAPGVSVAPQAEGDLGQRMAAAFATAFAGGASRVVLIGSDLPTLPPSALLDAFTALDGEARVVLGPAEDGGYYLIGLSAAPAPALFGGMPWGGPDVLARTIEAARRLGSEPTLIDPWYDVDERDDLARVMASGAPAPATRAWVDGVTDA